MPRSSITKKNPRQYIDDGGNGVGTLPAFAHNPRNLVPLYRAMILTRTFDKKAVALQRTGRLGTYPSSLGQEAVGIGVAAAMHSADVLLPSFREQSAMLWRGTTMQEILLYWGGDEQGNWFAQTPGDFPICVPVATHFPHAVGVAFALKVKNASQVAVAIAGDGATSKGDFYEAMNLAGVWNLPVVFVICNNQWAISVNRCRQTAAETLSQKSVAAGIDGIQVDGNDVVAVQHVVSEALENARRHNQPTVIEALTYRLTDHTTADDATRYRDDAEVSEQWVHEPVKRLRLWLEQNAGWSSAEEEALLQQIEDKVDQAVEDYLQAPAQTVASCFDHLYHQLPVTLSAQRDAAVSRANQDV